MMSRLELLEKEDRARRQRTISGIPVSLERILNINSGVLFYSL